MDDEAALKAQALSDNPATVVTKDPVARDTKLRSKFLKAGGELQPGQQVDHIQDLQLGGGNELSNLKGLNGSINASFGKQINIQIAPLKDGTRIGKVIYLPTFPKTK